MIPRLAKELILARLELSPAVGLVGPRQCGKTTLATSLGGTYYDLEQGPERLRLDLEWDSIARSNNLVILDEAQSWPDIFPRLRGAIDNERKRMGRFLILGSVSPALLVHVSESLAGRLALIELTPLLLQELTKHSDQDHLWLYGGFPDGGILEARQFPRWQTDYLTLLTQRDLPSWGLPAKPQTTNRLLHMLAASHGQVWNASRIGKSLGVNYKTVNTYLEYLVGAYLIRVLQPYHSNIGKRLVKSPKIYWRDSGLLHAILHVKNKTNLLTQPWIGSSWEGFCIEQTIATFASKGTSVQPYFLRTSDQYEIDLLLDFGDERWAIEFKLTTSPSPSDMEKLVRTADLIDASRCFLVSKTKTKAGKADRISCGLTEFLEMMGR